MKKRLSINRLQWVRHQIARTPQLAWNWLTHTQHHRNTQNIIHNDQLTFLSNYNKLTTLKAFGLLGHYLSISQSLRLFCVIPLIIIIYRQTFHWRSTGRLSLPSQPAAIERGREMVGGGNRQRMKRKEGRQRK